SSRSRCRCHSRDSAKRRPVSTNAPIAGCRVNAGPLTLITPSSSPVLGSWTGAAVQYQECCRRSKCSPASSSTGAASTSAVPMAFVPTRLSLHSAPSQNPSPSARRRTAGVPSRQRTTPSRSVMTSSTWEASDIAPTTCLSSVTTPRSGETSRRSASSSPARRPRTLSASACSPRRRTRDHDRKTIPRGRIGGRRPEMTASCIRMRSRAWSGRLRPGGTALGTLTVHLPRRRGEAESGCRPRHSPRHAIPCNGCPSPPPLPVIEITQMSMEAGVAMAQTIGREALVDSPQARVDAWLERFEAALTARDVETAARMFATESYWRDLVAFTWNIKTVEGREGVADLLHACLDHTAPSGFRVTEPPTEADGVVEAWLEFDTATGRGQGHLRLTDEGAWTLLTALRELKGFEEPRGPRRPQGVEHGVVRGRRS